MRVEGRGRKRKESKRKESKREGEKGGGGGDGVVGKLFGLLRLLKCLIFLPPNCSEHTLCSELLCCYPYLHLFRQLCVHALLG